MAQLVNTMWLWTKIFRVISKFSSDLETDCPVQVIRSYPLQIWLIHSLAAGKKLPDELWVTEVYASKATPKIYVPANTLSTSLFIS